MKGIEQGKNKEILCVIVSDFIGVDVLKESLESRPKTELQDALLQLGEYQYLPYDTVKNPVTNNQEEKIISLKTHTNRNTIESALTQIVNEVQKTL